MSPAADACLVRLLLDRELAISAALHDLGGPLTAMQGWAELSTDLGGRGLDDVMERITAYLALIGDPRPGPPVVAEIAGCRVSVHGPIDILRIAIDDLPHREVRAWTEPDGVRVEIHGVPLEENASGWTLAEVRAWRATGGPGLAGARLRIAARVVGALRVSFTLSEERDSAIATIRLPRG